MEALTSIQLPPRVSQAKPIDAKPDTVVQEQTEHDEAVSEAHSARAEEAARSDEPTRARQTAPSDNTVADAKRELIAFALKGGALDIRA